MKDSDGLELDLLLKCKLEELIAPLAVWNPTNSGNAHRFFYNVQVKTRWTQDDV